MLPETLRREYPLIPALVLVGTILGGLLVGYEPVGGDPDRMYRPLKSELARSLEDGKFPFWSHRFGLGVPLVAESHVAAFYPPNLVLYRLLDVSTAYRLSMWLHYLALVATTYFYARCLGIAPWGGALAAVTFTLCGFQAIHSSHEPFYCLMPYLPMALGLAERFLATGRLGWLAALPITLGLQWTLGHFQIQTWTGGLIIATGLWRTAFDRRPWRRAFALVLAVVWGAALAAVQLGPTWQFSEQVKQTQRPASELLFYSLPPAHWFEPALPRLVRELRLGPEDPYWFSQQTTGYEAVLYVGTIPLILAFIGAFTWPVARSTLPWLILIPVSLAIATMPRWWPQGYLYLISLPGIGYFRVPARYTLLTCLGTALLAGEGFDRSVASVRFRLGLAAAILFGGCATVAAAFWTMRPGVNLHASIGGVADGFLWAALAWSAALAILAAWRSGRIGTSAVLIAAAVELGILYYAGTTQWGWSIAIPAQSPVLDELARKPKVGLIGGELDNLPVRANLGTAFPYLGFAHTYPDKILVVSQERIFRSGPRGAPDQKDTVTLRRWFRRCRVTHLVDYRGTAAAFGKDVVRRRDRALDQIIYHPAGEPASRTWAIVELDEPFPEARVALRSRTIDDRLALINRLSLSDDRDIAWFLVEDRVPARPDARSARLLDWDGTTATVEHDGPCDLILARSFDPGWTARIDDGPRRPVLPVDGGFQAVRLDGSGTHRVTMHYRTPRFTLWTAITIVAAILDLGTVAASIAASKEQRLEASG
ncbi:MAG: hypothetical protein ACLQGP_28455 [Isosphaeraceae bacterium]